MSQTCEPTALTRAEAQAVLADGGVRAAYMVDAVLSGVLGFGQHLAGLTPHAPGLTAFFSQVDPSRIQFAVFADGKPLEYCAYEYDPDAEDMAGPRLCRTDARGQEDGTSSTTRQLQPFIDFALARMEAQVWARVKAA